MAWVVDTCILIDVLEHDPTFGRHSATCLDAALAEGLVICPITYVELAPAFQGNRELQEEFLHAVGAVFTTPWTVEHTKTAFAAWHRRITRQRREGTPRRPVADVLIGAFATTHDGLITRNTSDFRSIFEQLRLWDPMRSSQPC